MIMDANPTFGQFLLMKVSRRHATRSVTRARTGGLVILIRVILHIAGFACLTYAAYLASIIAGITVAGLSCFVMSTLFAQPRATQEQMRQ